MKKRTFFFISMGILFFVCMGSILNNPVFKPVTAIAQKRTVLTANQLLIVDQKGKVRVAINPAGSNSEYTGLTMYDNNGVGRFVLQVNPDNRLPTVTYFDKTGKIIDNGYKSSSSPFYSGSGVSGAAFAPVLQEIQRLSNEVEKLKSHHH